MVYSLAWRTLRWAMSVMMELPPPRVKEWGVGLVVARRGCMCVALSGAWEMGTTLAVVPGVRDVRDRALLVL